MNPYRSGPARDWFYLSFAGETAFLGGVIVEANNLLMATLAAHLMGINPGGEVFGHPVPFDKLPPPELRNKLLSKEQIKSIWPDACSMGEFQRARMN